MDEEHRDALTSLLKEYREQFAWKPNDMPGISVDIISHELRIDSFVQPIARKRRSFGFDKRLTIKQEGGKLLDARFVREVRFQSGLTNPVLVNKSNGKWRICVEFWDFNKAFPKDSYPLP